MDFPETRRKASKRAASRAGEGARAPAAPRDAPGGRARGRRRRSLADDPVVTEKDVVEGALIAEMQGRREPPARSLPDDGFFITTRGPPGPRKAGPRGPGKGGQPGPGKAGPAASREGAPPAAAAAPEGMPEADPLEEFFFQESEVAAATRRDWGPGLAEALREVLTFRLGPEEYAVGVEVVREILKAPPITEVPRAPAHVLGVILLRGQVVPVHDPRRRLGLPAAGVAAGARVVVCDAGEGLVGLLVDGVVEVLRLPPSAIEARPQGIAGIDSEYIAGVGREGGRLFVLLDAGALLRGGSPRKGEA